jgi:hypothetical protein
MKKGLEIGFGLVIALLAVTGTFFCLLTTLFMVVGN